jgi:hypothetical protein
VQDADQGANIVFLADDPSDIAWVRMQVGREARRLLAGECPMPVVRSPERAPDVPATGPVAAP